MCLQWCLLRVLFLNSAECQYSLNGNSFFFPLRDIWIRCLPSLFLMLWRFNAVGLLNLFLHLWVNFIYLFLKLHGQLTQALWSEWVLTIWQVLQCLELYYSDTVVQLGGLWDSDCNAPKITAGGLLKTSCAFPWHHPKWPTKWALCDRNVICIRCKCD